MPDCQLPRCVHVHHHVLRLGCRFLIRSDLLVGVFRVSVCACPACLLQARVALWVERGLLRMPRSLKVPLILVGPGTGACLGGGGRLHTCLAEWVCPLCACSCS